MHTNVAILREQLKGIRIRSDPLSTQAINLSDSAQLISGISPARGMPTSHGEAQQSNKVQRYVTAVARSACG